MATAFTHAFVGGACGLGSPVGVPRGRLLAVTATLAVLPDLDVLAFAAGIPYEHWLGHRGLTHSLPFALGAGLLATALFPRVRPLSPRWWRLALVLIAAAATHGVLDALTDAGLGVGFWVPFDMQRTFFPWRPLPTSPLGVTAFFRGRGAAILATEIQIIWIPVLLVSAVVALGRRRPWGGLR